MSASSVQAIFKSGFGLKVLYLAIAGLVLSGIIAHAQYIVKVGEFQVVVLIPLALSFMLTYSCGVVQDIVERGMRAKKLRPTYGKATSSKYWFDSLVAEVITKTCLITLGGFAGMYFLLSLFLIAAPPLVTFVISIDVAGVAMLLLPSYIQDKQVIRKR